jgi:hypothetical protein
LRQFLENDSYLSSTFEERFEFLLDAEIDCPKLEVFCNDLLVNPECGVWDPHTNLLVKNGCSERIIDSKVSSIAPQATNLGAILFNITSEIYLFYQFLGSGSFLFSSNE